jgi:phenylalanyl-tRNA synthetase beta subunit
LQDVKPFDVYEGKNLALGKKSYALKALPFKTTRNPH